MSSVVQLKPRSTTEVQLMGSEAQAAQIDRAHLAQAIRTGDLSLLPTRRSEAWRWSDLRAAVRTMPAASPEGSPEGEGPFAAIHADGEIVIANGRRLSGDGPLVIEGEQTWRLRIVSTAQAGAHSAELAITLAPGAKLTLLESYEGEGAGYVCGFDLSLTLPEGARCERIVILNDAADAVTVSSAAVKPSPGALFSQTVVTTGAKLQRHETRIVHPGDGAAVRMDGIYMLDGRAHADLTSVVEHRGENGATSQLCKGVVTGRARAVFQGRIVVAPGADGTDARMRHSALILSEGAEIDAKPELEIYADDVQCAHGNTIGALDDELLFYIRSRGLPETEARALLTEAFLGEVVERIEHEGGREVITALVAARLLELGR